MRDVKEGGEAKRGREEREMLSETAIAVNAQQLITDFSVLGNASDGAYQRGQA